MVRQRYVIFTSLQIQINPDTFLAWFTGLALAEEMYEHMQSAKINVEEFEKQFLVMERQQKRKQEQLAERERALKADKDKFHGDLLVSQMLDKQPTLNKH